MHLLVVAVVLLVGSGIMVVVDNAVNMRYESTPQRLAHIVAYMLWGWILLSALFGF